MKSTLKKIAKQVLPKDVQRQLRAAFGPNGQPDWSTILRRDRTRWHEALRAAENGPKVLIATTVGGQLPATHLESALAIALTLRGADVHILLCDGRLPACQQAQIGQFPDPAEFAARGPASLCDACHRPAAAMYKSLGLKVHMLSDLVQSSEAADAAARASSVPVDEISAMRMGDVPVGEHALAGALRFYARGDLSGEPTGEATLRRYVEAAITTVHAMRRLMEREHFDAACFHHGIYVPQGLIGEVAREQAVRVVNWNPAYRKQCFIFSHGDTYHHTLLDEPVANWSGLDFSSDMNRQIGDYLVSRWSGSRDWIWFHEKPQEQLAPIAAETGIDFSKPVIGLLTNVFWDAQLHYRANAFPNMLEWIFESIRYFAQRPDLQLAIRVHPAEIRGAIPSRQLVADEIAAAFPRLPPNVILIPPESQVSTYALMAQCDAVVIYGTKTGVELTSMGIPVIVAGEAWIRNKGLTTDVTSRDEYRQTLDRLPFGTRLDERTVEQARKYAYHFFFRRMIPIGFMEPTGKWPPYRAAARSLDALEHGRDAGLDVICEGILTGREFIFPAEVLGVIA
jgi:hypothetical protein